MPAKAKPRVLVLGGGFGGLEAALYMRMKMPERAEITLISDHEHFLFKPNTIYVPFGLDPDKLKFRLSRPAKRKNIHFAQSTVREVDPIAKHVLVDGYGHNYPLAYDYLVVATGAGMRLEEIPGLIENASTIWTPDQMVQLRDSFRELVAKAKDARRQAVLFLVPPNSDCSGPLYEMVMMLDTWLRRKSVRDQIDIIWSTFEEHYIQIYGPRLHEVVTTEFAQRGIKGFNKYVVDHVEKDAVVYRNGERIPFDLLVSFPPLVASTHFSNLPADERGFIRTDLETRRVSGYPEVFAVGDTADFPVKQAQLAFLQADAAANHLSADILGEQPSLNFDPVSMALMEQFDNATFARVPLRLTGNPDSPVEVREDEERMYRIGSSPVWRLGKLALGVYLPWRFKAGNPFHTGAPWKGIEASLKVMSGLLAH